MRMTVLLCPLCSQPRFTNLESLRVSLVNAATQNISCPICDDIVTGLDKLTIHLFGHTLETGQRPSLELKTSKSIEGPCLEATPDDTSLRVTEPNGNPPLSDDKMVFPETSKTSFKYDGADKFMAGMSASYGGPEAPKMFPDGDAKSESLCTVNMEDLGFLTSWECGVKPKADERTAEGMSVDNEKQENGDISEYMSDLLNKKLPILNFSHPGDDAEEKKKSLENPGSEKNQMKCEICGSVLPNSIILSLHEELVHSKSKSSGKRNFLAQGQADDKTEPGEERGKYEFFPELLCRSEKADDGGGGGGGGGEGGGGDEPVGNEEISEATLPRYDCHLCPKSFKMKGSLLLHFRVAHFGLSSPDSIQILGDMSPPGERNHPCPICGKLFKKEQHLTQHVKTHEGKQWQCETCNKHFTTKYFLKKHQRLHTGEMPYSCLTCNKTFTFQQSYHKHLLYHSDEKPHQCTQCGRSFKELSTLHNHQRIHSGEKPFACETCGKCFRQRVSYIVHQRIHTGVLPYQCTACKKKFRYKVSQRSHKCTAQPPGVVIRQPDIVQKILENKLILQQNPG